MGEEHPMFEEAERTGQWFYLPSLQRWLSPAALRRKQVEGAWVNAPDEGEGWVLAAPPPEEIAREAQEDVDAGRVESPPDPATDESGAVEPPPPATETAPATSTAEDIGPVPPGTEAELPQSNAPATDAPEETPPAAPSGP